MMMQPVSSFIKFRYHIIMACGNSNTIVHSHDQRLLQAQQPRKKYHSRNFPHLSTEVYIVHDPVYIPLLLF